MKICAVDNCESKMYARGWCRLHYIRAKKHGDPLRGSKYSYAIPDSVEDLAYLAGLIDGEAHVGFTPREGYLFIAIAMTDKEVVEWVAETCGGKARVKHEATETRKKQWVWSTAKRDFLEELTCKVTPYMKVISKRNTMLDYFHENKS